MITVYSNNTEILVNKVTFSDGTFNFNISNIPEKPRYISINIDPSTRGCIVREEISLVVDAIQKLKDCSDSIRILSIPYLYNARADRRFVKGDSYPLKNFLTFLQGLKFFDEIHICDIHNMQAVKDIMFDYSLDLNITEKSQLDCFKDSLSYDTKKDFDLVIAPDKGAVEKAKTVAEYLGVGCVFANKVRDVATGKLTEMNLPDYDFTGKKVLIPDDIGDGMGTHVWLGELLKQSGAKEVDLYVTHLIAPKGLKHLTGVIDKVYCYQTVAGYINKQTVLDFNLGK